VALPVLTSLLRTPVDQQHMNLKRRILSAANKLAILQLYGKNVTQNEIARLLDLNKSIVSRVICRHDECGSV